VEILTEQGVMIEAKPYENNVGFSQRADVPIEPRLSEQWFLKYPAVEQCQSLRSSRSDSERVPMADARASAESLASVRRRALSGKSAARPAGRATDKMHFHPQRWAKVYDPLADEHSGLVHQPPALVGASDPVWRKRVTSRKKTGLKELKSWGWDWYLENGGKPLERSLV